MKSEEEINNLIEKLSILLQNSPAGNLFTQRRLALLDALMWVKGNGEWLIKGDIDVK